MTPRALLRLIPLLALAAPLPTPAPSWADEGAGADAAPFTGARFAPGGAEGRRLLLQPGGASGAAACEGCHADIAAQWGQSAHRFASFNNIYYAAAVEAFRRERPAAVGRFCAGCHDPALLIDDRFIQPGPLLGLSRRREPEAHAASQAGLTCLLCHSISHAHDRRGNGAYTLTLAPVPAAVASKEDKAAHSGRLRPALLAQPELCRACHKVGLGPAVTEDPEGGWYRGQNDYDAWQASAAAGQGVGNIYRDQVKARRCQDCHMPLEPTASGRMVRSHRFLAANSALPHLRGDADMLWRTAEFLRGAVSLDLVVPEARVRTPAGVLAAEVAVPGSGVVTVDVVLRNRRVGHRFPSGTMDSNEVYVAVEAGGLRNEDHLVRAQPVDGDAEPIARRDVQHLRGVIFDTSLSPADPQVIRYQIDLDALPAPRPRTLQVRAALRYRKFSKDYAAFACAQLPPGTPKEQRRRCADLPVLEVAAAERVLHLDGGAPPEAVAAGVGEPWERLLDHGVGLADGLAEQAGLGLPSLRAAAALAPARAEPQLGLCRLYLALGRTEDVVAACGAAQRLRAEHPAALWLLAQAQYRTYHFREARAPLERAAGLLPGDRSLLGMLARVRGITGDAPGALQAAEALLRLDPESEEGHYQRMLALRESGREAEAREAEQRYLYHRRRSEQDLQLRERFRARHPERAQEDAPAHSHLLRAP